MEISQARKTFSGGRRGGKKFRRAVSGFYFLQPPEVVGPRAISGYSSILHLI